MANAHLPSNKVKEINRVLLDACDMAMQNGLPPPRAAHDAPPRDQNRETAGPREGLMPPTLTGLPKGVEERRGGSADQKSSLATRAE